jgi:hypothetical protein
MLNSARNKAKPDTMAWRAVAIELSDIPTFSRKGLTFLEPPKATGHNFFQEFWQPRQPEPTDALGQYLTPVQSFFKK